MCVANARPCCSGASTLRSQQRKRLRKRRFSDSVREPREHRSGLRFRLRARAFKSVGRANANASTTPARMGVRCSWRLVLVVVSAAFVAAHAQHDEEDDEDVGPQSGSGPQFANEDDMRKVRCATCGGMRQRGKAGATDRAARRCARLASRRATARRSPAASSRSRRLRRRAATRRPPPPATHAHRSHSVRSSSSASSCTS